jgi:hypothetical protein
MTGLQLYNGGAATVANNANLIFNSTAALTDPNITFNSATGVVTFAAAETYYVSWSVSCQTAAAATGVVFSLVSSALTANSSSNIKNGVVTGSAILSVAAGSTLALVNKTGGAVALPSSVPTNASMSIVNSAETPVGFSAFISNVSASSSTQLANWSTAAPHFSSPSFNAATGNFTVPKSGRYAILATINFSTTAAITVGIGSGVNPAFEVTRTSPTSANLITALMPVINLNLALLSIRSILGSGSINLAGEVLLNAGDVIGLFYQSSGLTLNLNLGNSSGIVWSVQKIS